MSINNNSNSENLNPNGFNNHNTNGNGHKKPEMDFEDFEMVDTQELESSGKQDTTKPTTNNAINHLRKYTKINDDARENMISRSSQESIYADTVEKLNPEQRLQKAMDIYIETINRNLPEIDQNLVRNLVNDAVEGMLPLVFKASEEIKHRYEDTGKFEGYEHPAIKAIIEKHLMSAHNSSKGTFKKIMEILGTPMHEIFGKGNHVMGEQGKVYNNVHTAVTRGGTIFAAGLAIKELSTLFPPVLGIFPPAVPLAGVLFTMTQAINEVTNEAEHTTLEKKDPRKIFTKWTTIAAAKAAPIALLAISSMGGISPNLEQHYLKNEGQKLYTEVVDRSNKQASGGEVSRLQAKLKEINDEIADKEAQLAKTLKGDPMRESLNRKLDGAASKFMQKDEVPLKQQKTAKELEIKTALEKNAKLIAEYENDGPVKFIIKNASLKYGDNAGASARFRETINDYSKLDAAARISNGWDYMGRKLSHVELDSEGKPVLNKDGKENWTPELTDELFTMIYIAMLVESLSVITLLLVQSRADFRKVITNSDSQKALASIIEGAILLNKQVGAEADFNEFRSDEDKLLTQHKDKQNGIENKFTKLSVQSSNQDSEFKPKNVNAQKIMQFRSDISEIAKALLTGGKEKEAVRVEPPSYSSLVKSVAVQQAIQEMYRDGHVPSMNQVIHDISRDLIRPIPVVPVKKKKLSSEQEEEDVTNAQKLKEVARNEQLENNPAYAATLPKKLTMGIEKDVIGGTGRTMDVMKHNLENLLARYIPLNEKVMREEIAKNGEGKVEKYDDMIRSLKEAIAELGYTIERNDASDERLDLKNKINEDIKNAIAKFESNKENFVPSQNYSNSSKEMRENVESEESNTPMNYQRMEGAISYIKGEMGFNSMTPELLVKMVDILRKGGAIHHYSKGWGKGKQNDMLTKIEALMLASPYQPAIQECINKMQIAATEELAKTRTFGMVDKQAFKQKISDIIIKYEKAASVEQKEVKETAKNKPGNPANIPQPKPDNTKSKFDLELDTDEWDK
jgi:hypothetical protein